MISTRKPNNVFILNDSSRCEVTVLGEESDDHPTQYYRSTYDTEYNVCGGKQWVIVLHFSIRSGYAKKTLVGTIGLQIINGVEAFLYCQIEGAVSGDTIDTTKLPMRRIQIEAPALCNCGFCH